jgi:hypothetical protein
MISKIIRKSFPLNFFTVIFNGIGLAAVKKKKYCLSVTYFVYLTFSAFIMYFDCLTSKYNFIPASLNSLMACVVLRFSRGLRERRWIILGFMTDGIQNNPINCSMNGFNGQQVTYSIHMISRSEPYLTYNIVSFSLSYLSKPCIRSNIKQFSCIKNKY